MNWNSLIQKIFFRVEKSDQKIVDGIIISDQTESSSSDRTGSDRIESDESDRMNQIGSDSSDQIGLNRVEQEPLFYPVVIPSYPPCFLVDDHCNGDLGLFYHWLECNRYKAFRAYISDIQVWRDRLNGHLDTAEIIRVIAEYLPNSLTRAKRMMYSLKVYGQYRRDYGDPRISLILAIDERKLRLPNPRREKFSLALSPGAIEMLDNQSKALCTEGDRAGIWLGLLLRGVPASAVKTIEIIGKHQIRFRNWTKMVELRVQEWLILSMTERISEALWRMNRVTIQKRVRAYENPMTLYKNASISLSVLGE